MLELIFMYSEYNKKDMWHVERVEEKEGEPYYYGPFFNKEIAQSFIDNFET